MSNKDVFISYKAEEFSEASWVKNTLETNGVTCWMAPQSIPGGSSYASEIETAIKNCKVFVLILSQNSQNSKWVTKELDRALNCGKIIMPFDIDNYPLNNAFNFYLTDVQRFDAFAGKSKAFEKMLDEIKKLLADSIPTADSVSEPATAVDQPALQTSAVSEPEPEPVSQPAQKAATKPAVTAVKSKSKKKTAAIIGIAVAAVAVLAFVILILIEAFPKENTIQKDGGVLSTVEELDDFNFVLEGVEYQIPCRFEKLSENGWGISSPSGSTPDSLVPGKDYVVLTLTNGKKSIEIYSYNTSGNSVAIKECNVGYISGSLKTDAQLSLLNGITASSASDEIIGAFGTPYTHTFYKDKNLDVLTYRINDESNVYIKFERYNGEEDFKNSSVTISNFVTSEIDPNETNTQSPSYFLSDLVPPTLLGDDISSGNIEIEGDIYSLPTSIKNFINNGWEIIDAPEAIVSLGNRNVTIKKDGKTIKVTLTNFAEYQTVAENCAVTVVEIGDKVNATLAGGPNIGLEKVYADTYSDFNVTKYSSYYSYSFTQSEPYISVEYRVDIKTKKVNCIRWYCNDWC